MDLTSKYINKVIYTGPQDDSLDCCKPAIPVPKRPKTKTGWVLEKEEEEENTMDTNNITEREREGKRYYLSRRLRDVESRLLRKAGAHFGTQDDEYPKSWPDLLARIKSGKFVYDEESAKASSIHDDDCYGNPFDYISWRDPDKERDWDGFKAWKREKLTPAMDAVHDAIQLLSPEEALVKIQELEKVEIK